MRGLSSEGRQVQIGTRPRRNRAKEQFWRKVVAEQRRSRLTVRAFCESRGLTEPSFYAWRAELARRDQRQRAVLDAASAGSSRRTVARRGQPRSTTPSSSFVALTVEKGPPATPAIEIELPGGERLRVSGGCDRTTLDVVLGALRARPC